MDHLSVNNVSPRGWDVTECRGPHMVNYCVQHPFIASLATCIHYSLYREAREEDRPIIGDDCLTVPAIWSLEI